ncbi:MAG: hypothetical protein P8M30_11915 [Planctomycetaceae bacterium]|nr:hypothetical protein [Planctomycetaceae bacterium]
MSLKSIPTNHHAQTSFAPLSRMALVVVATLFMGCQEETIHSYVAPKAKPISMSAPMAPSGPAEPTRMLASILRQPEQTWFFKVTAPPEEAAALREQFGKFVASTTFKNDKPSWEIPEGWIEKSGNQFRFATFQMGATGPDLSVSTLPSSEDEVSGAVANINRWRGQLGLADLETEQYQSALAAENDAEILPEEEGEIVSITTPAGQAILVDFVGAMSSGGGAPFANMGGTSPRTPTPQTPPSTSSSGSAKFSPPDHWKQGELNSMRKAAYVVGEGENLLDITVIPLSSQSGSLLDNVNRWRGQVQLPDWTEQELTKANKNLIGQGFTADSVKLIGPEETILGAIISRGDRNWFVKLKGPNDLAEQEAENFEQFVKTIEF